MKSPESLVTKHVLQGVLKVTYGLLFALCNKMAATWSILVAAILCSDVFRPINQSIRDKSLYLRDNGI